MLPGNYGWAPALLQLHALDTRVHSTAATGHLLALGDERAIVSDLPPISAVLSSIVAAVAMTASWNRARWSGPEGHLFAAFVAFRRLAR